MAKFLIMTIQVTLVPNPSETWKRQHTELSLLKILPLAPFLGHHLGFHTMASLGPHPFLQLGCFGLDNYYIHTYMHTYLAIMYHSSGRGITIVFW